MRVRLRGINKVRRKLADGKYTVYYYAWKGGPRLSGLPGTPEFIKSYQDANASSPPTPAGKILRTIFDMFLDSADFSGLADRSQSDYRKIVGILDKEFGALPAAALAAPECKGIFRSWRDERAKRSKRQADYAWSVLARILSWALDGGMITANPCQRGGRLYHGSRAEKVWTDADEAAFVVVAGPEMRLALMLALWTGQRQGDLLALTWSAYDGTAIRLKQSKTGARVSITVGEPLKELLDATKRVSTQILVSTDKRPWTPDSFRVAWGRATKRAGLSGLTFHDLRGTAVTRLALSGCTEAEIVTVTGHTLSDVKSILDKHYLNRDPALGRSAIAKLEKRKKEPEA